MVNRSPIVLLQIVRHLGVRCLASQFSNAHGQLRPVLHALRCVLVSGAPCIRLAQGALDRDRLVSARAFRLPAPLVRERVLAVRHVDPVNATFREV